MRAVSAFSLRRFILTAKRWTPGFRLGSADGKSG